VQVDAIMYNYIATNEGDTMKSYQNTVTEWREYFEALEVAGIGTELVACAIWTKESVEEAVSVHGYRLEMTQDEWARFARKTEEYWEEFDENDLDAVVSEFNLQHEGEE
jgi:hypothetical protein